MGQQLRAETDAEHRFALLQHALDAAQFGDQVWATGLVRHIHRAAEHHQALVAIDIGLGVWFAFEIDEANTMAARSDQRVQRSQRFGSDMLKHQNARHRRSDAALARQSVVGGQGPGYVAVPEHMRLRVAINRVANLSKGDMQFARPARGTEKQRAAAAAAKPALGFGAGGKPAQLRFAVIDDAALTRHSEPGDVAGAVRVSAHAAVTMSQPFRWKLQFKCDCTALTLAVRRPIQFDHSTSPRTMVLQWPPTQIEVEDSSRISIRASCPISRPWVTG